MELKFYNNFKEDLFVEYKIKLGDEIHSKYRNKIKNAEKDRNFSLGYTIILPILWIIMACCLCVIIESNEWREFLLIVTLFVIGLFFLSFSVLYVFNHRVIKRLKSDYVSELDNLEGNRFDNSCKEYQLYSLSNRLKGLSKLKLIGIVSNKVILDGKGIGELEIPLHIVSFTTSNDVKCSSISVDNEKVTIILKEN